MKYNGNNNGIRITKSPAELPEQYLQRLLDIATHYIPDRELMDGILRTHLQQADSIRLAWCEEQIVGFSIASRFRTPTPFYPRPINALYVRMLFIEPGKLYQGLGRKLLMATLRDVFGWYWPFRRFVAICRTQNPVVVRIMNLYNVAYPQADQPLPADIRKFCEGLLPMLNSDALDEKCRLAGTLGSLSGMDYTDIWNRYLHRRNNKYERLMLDSAFHEENGRIINSGSFVLVIGYAKPFHFLRYLFR